MVNISDFSSVFEIGFAMGLILGIFAYVPMWDMNMEKLLERAEKTIDKLEGDDAPHPAETGALLWATGAYLGRYKEFVILSCALGSIISLVMLLTGAFRPEAEMSGWWMALILLVILVPTPGLMIFGWYKREVYFDLIQESYRPSKPSSSKEET